MMAAMAMHFRFDENDDLVIDDIPDDIMALLEGLAHRNGRTVEDEMRDVLIALANNWKANDQ